MEICKYGHMASCKSSAKMVCLIHVVSHGINLRITNHDVIRLRRVLVLGPLLRPIINY